MISSSLSGPSIQRLVLAFAQNQLPLKGAQMTLDHTLTRILAPVDVISVKINAPAPHQTSMQTIASASATKNRTSALTLAMSSTAPPAVATALPLRLWLNWNAHLLRDGTRHLANVSAQLHHRCATVPLHGTH